MKRSDNWPRLAGAAVNARVTVRRLEVRCDQRVNVLEIRDEGRRTSAGLQSSLKHAASRSRAKRLLKFDKRPLWSDIPGVIGDGERPGGPLATPGGRA